MTAEIISIGTELLMGQIANTDAQYIAQKLNELGINLYHQTTVGDNQDRLVECLSQAMDRSGIIITSGGLGPTEDDLTKWGVAQYLGVKMVEDAESKEHLENYFQHIKREISPNNYRQIMFPEGATIMPNSCGTAPGCICERDGKYIIVLPGPPHELKAMMEQSVMPYLEAKADRRIHSRVLRIFGIGESTVEYTLRDMIHNQTNPTIAPYAGFIEVSLRVTARTKLNEDPSGMIEPVIAQICDRLGEGVYSTDNEEMPQVVAKLLKQKRKTVAIAESLTGGAVCSEMVNVPGMSQYLLEGVVTYTNEAKERLGVSHETLTRYSAVSQQVAVEMAKCVRTRAGANIGLSTTGVAGPGTDANGNPEGLIYIGISDVNGDRAIRIESGWERRRIRHMAMLSALNELRKSLQS